MTTWYKKPFVIMGFGAGFGVITYLVKVLRQNNNDEFIEIESNRISRALKVPRGFVGRIVGKGGVTIKSICEKSNARITINDEDKEFAVVSITGFPEAVEEAANLVNEIIKSSHASFTKEIVLQENITDFIWKNMNYIRKICDLTRAKITFDFHPSMGKISQVKILIKGRKEEVDSAVELIDEFVVEVEVTSCKQSHVAGRALPDNLRTTTLEAQNKHLQLYIQKRIKKWQAERKKKGAGTTNVVAANVVVPSVKKSTQENDEGEKRKTMKVENDPLDIAFMKGIRNLPCEKLVPNSRDGDIEIYVSAIENPSKFWVQISGSKSIQMDKLVTQMTEFYNEEKNKDRLQLGSINVGDIVAAYYESNNSWYRAQVVKVSNEDNEQKTIGVFDLDFGESASLNPDLVCILLSDFLSLPFQAIECCLAYVEPKGDVWSLEGIEYFEEIVSLKKWKVIMAKPIQKAQLNGGKDSQISTHLVQLLSTNSERDIIPSEVLVQKGFAKLVE